MGTTIEQAGLKKQNGAQASRCAGKAEKLTETEIVTASEVLNSHKANRTASSKSISAVVTRSQTRESSQYISLP